MARPLFLVCGKDPIEEQGGGVGSYVRGHARAAIALGYEPHLFSVGHHEGIVETEFGVVHRRMTSALIGNVPGVGVRGLWIPFYAGQLSRYIERFALKGPNDLLIHSFAVWGYIGRAAARALRANGRRVHHAVSGYTTHRHEAQGKTRSMNEAHSLPRRLSERSELPLTMLVSNHYERKAFTGADVILYNYESARRLIELEHCPSAPFVKLPYAPETAFTRPDEVAGSMSSDDRPGPPLIVAVSRQDPRKGLDVLLQALAIVAASGRQFRARLVGGGVLLDDHRRLAAGLGLDGVEIPGFVPDAYQELCRGDIFVLPSLEEGSGSLSLLEALQAGLAPVVSDCDGLPEDISEGENGLLVPPGDRDALAAAITKLIDDSELRRRLAEAARRTFELRFNVATFTESLGAAYDNLGGRP